MGEGSEGGGYYPHGAWPSVPHYYGDYVRQFMLGAAALMLFTAPFYGESIRTELPFIVIGTLVLVALAAATNPWKQNVMTYDAIASGVGLTIFQTWAVWGYEESTLLAFVFRQALALIFLAAFYFSVKTVRAMILHQIGKRDSNEEFGAEKPVSNIVLPRFRRRTPKQKPEFLNRKPSGD